MWHLKLRPFLIAGQKAVSHVAQHTHDCGKQARDPKLGGTRIILFDYFMTFLLLEMLQLVEIPQKIMQVPGLGS